MSSSYDQIREHNIKGYGENTHHLDFLSELYSDRTHFVFELLQNAEDAGASQIQLELFEDRLEVVHDGRRFNDDDVRGVCGVGEGTKSREDLNQIGKFGIGFKSVFAYTDTPEIHSGDESFRIEHYVRPFAVNSRPIQKPWTTLFIFRFDNHDKITPETAFCEIDECLLSLSVRTLLFLKKIKQIRCVYSSGSGVYTRSDNTLESAKRIELVKRSSDSSEITEHWLVFARPVKVHDSDETVYAEIGFRLETNIEGKNAEFIERENDTPLIVWFPTEKPTGLGFLVQGPFRTTPARDNIPGHDGWNKQLIVETGELIVESVRKLKEMSLLTVSVLELLPINAEHFSDENMFYPIFERVRRALMDEELIPTDDGNFVSARNGKLGRSSSLMKLLGTEELRVLFQSEDEIMWLSSDITLDRTPGLRNYLMKNLDVEEVTPEVIAHRLSEWFLASQSDDWFIRFYEFLSGQEALWQAPRWSGDAGGILRKKPIIRLQNGQHVVPFNDDDNPNAYLADGTDTLSSLPVVKTELSRRESVRRYLKELGIRELDVVEVVLDQILPKYRNSIIEIKPEEYKSDLRQIGKAYRTDCREKKERLREELCSSWFVLAEKPNEREQVFLQPDQVYFESDELREYFEGNVSFSCVSTDHQYAEMLKYLGVAERIRIETNTQPGSSNDVDLEGYYNYSISPSRWIYRRGVGGFDPDIEVDGLDKALHSLSSEKGRIIWNEIAVPYRQCIRGVVRESSTWNFSTTAGYFGEKEETSQFGKLLKENAWLPDKNGHMLKPSELFLDDLPDSFVRDEELASRLGMKKDAVVKLAEEAGISKEALDFAKEYDNSEEFRDVIKNYRDKGSKPQPEGTDNTPYGEALASAFSGTGKLPTDSNTGSGGSSQNPERRRQKTRQDIAEAISSENSGGGGSSTLTLRKNWKNKNDSVRTSFKEWYGGRCQICGSTFMQRNGEPYFEGLYLVSRTAANWVDREGNVLCLCAEHSAMFQFGTKKVDEDFAQQVLRLKTLEEAGNSDLAVRMTLCGNPVEIKYADKHLIDLQELIRVSKDVDLKDTSSD